MNEQVIGRDREINTLESMSYSKKAEFVAIYGRRRIGKTHLINSFFAEKNDLIYFKVTGSKDAPMKEQIRHFTNTISRVFYRSAELAQKKNWDETFELLTKSMDSDETGKPIILFFDELPWMATHNSRLLQNLEYYWNQFWSHNPRIKLIACGSSASWIVNKIINNRGGLHNRITHKLRLKPFNLLEAREFLLNQKIKLSNEQILQIYMITGGVPYYLSMVEKGKSAMQLIDKLAFSEDGFLFHEFDNIFSSLFDDAPAHIELLKIIAKNHHGLSQTQISEQSALAKTGGRITEKLKALKEAGFIMAFKPYKHSRKGTYYQVIDEYSLFYFNWIEPLKGSFQELSLGENYWQGIYGTPRWQVWAGYAFEAVIYKHLQQVRRKLEIPATAIAASWRYSPLAKSKEQGAQIDLLFDRPDEAVTLCEIKYTKEPFLLTKQYLENLLNKGKVFSKKAQNRKQQFLALVSARGVKENDYAKDYLAGVVGLDDLFN